MVVFKKPWQGYAPGERAGFGPEAEAVLVRTGWAVDATEVGTVGPSGDGSARERALAAAAAQGHPAPDLRPDAPGGGVGSWELLTNVDHRPSREGGGDPPAAQATVAAAPLAGAAPPGEEVGTSAGPSPQDLRRRSGKKR